MLITSSWIVDLALIFTLFLYFLYKYFTRNFDHWKKQGVFYFKPTPFFGNFSETFKLKTTISEHLKTFYDKTDKPYFGLFLLDKPVLVIKSAELVKRILIKDFSYFNDRTMAAGKHNKIINNWLVFQNYSDWKMTRPKLAPMFSSGKLKYMFNSVSDVSKELVDYMNQNLGILESKVFCRKFTVEVVARCFFGITGHCFKDENSAFNQIGHRSFDLSFRNGIIQSLYLLRPTLVELFRLNFMRQSDMDYLLDAFETTFNKRKIQHSQFKGKNKDYIDIMLNFEEQDKNESFAASESGYLMAKANAIQFFIAGQETTSALMSFMMYDWAVHPHVQEKVRQEIISVYTKHGSFTFESLQELEYLEMCMNETGRRFPALHVLDRRAVMDYKVPGTDFVIKKGTDIFIPFYSLHLDEKYFPEPEKYIPERFLNKDINSDGLYYMPFGAGPRICIGTRFAQMATKLSLAMVLMAFKIEVCDETPIPIKFEPKSFTMISKDGLALKFTPLDKKII